MSDLAIIVVAAALTLVGLAFAYVKWDTVRRTSDQAISAVRYAELVARLKLAEDSLATLRIHAGLVDTKLQEIERTIRDMGNPTPRRTQTHANLFPFGPKK